MKKLVLGTAVFLSTILAIPAFAQGSAPANVQASASVASSADLACMSAAIDAREASLISARENFNADIVTALQTRRTSLKAAFTIANHHDRQVAVHAAVKAYSDSIAKARAQFSVDVKAAWKTFATARVACHIDADRDGDNKRPKPVKAGKDGRGLHLGWLKQMMNSDTRINARFHSDVDADTDLLQ